MMASSPVALCRFVVVVRAQTGDGVRAVSAAEDGDVGEPLHRVGGSAAPFERFDFPLGRFDEAGCFEERVADVDEAGDDRVDLRRDLRGERVLADAVGKCEADERGVLGFLAAIEGLGVTADIGVADEPCKRALGDDGPLRVGVDRFELEAFDEGFERLLHVQPRWFVLTM